MNSSMSRCCCDIEYFGQGHHSIAFLLDGVRGRALLMFVLTSKGLSLISLSYLSLHVEVDERMLRSGTFRRNSSVSEDKGI